VTEIETPGASEEPTGLADLSSPTQLKRVMASLGIRPRKRLGQNFLIDGNIRAKIIEASGAAPGVNVLEIGPGMGVLTGSLAATGANLTCVEIDNQLADYLKSALTTPNVKVVTADFLKADIPEILGDKKPWTVVANLPYYITSPILARLLENKQWFDEIIVMVQREVAARLMAPPGGGDYGSFSVFVQYHCEVESVTRVSRNCFYPPPEVDSEVIRLTVREKPAIKVCDEKLYFEIVRSAFGKRRKTLLNSLAGSTTLFWDKGRAQRVIDRAGIDPNRRAETLSLEEFARLANAAED
jgi:16S rRNA (adenine1518-N6/adenine1519-N6)-dimethyltransferase